MVNTADIEFVTAPELSDVMDYARSYPRIFLEYLSESLICGEKHAEALLHDFSLTEREDIERWLKT